MTTPTDKARVCDHCDGSGKIGISHCAYVECNTCFEAGRLNAQPSAQMSADDVLAMLKAQAIHTRRFGGSPSWQTIEAGHDAVTALISRNAELEVERDHARELASEACLVASNLRAERDALVEDNQALRELVNSPELHDFARGAVLEAVHQVERWGSEHDAGKTPADWFWLVGYLAGKALHAQTSGNTEKALHHTISTAGALANWHRTINGANDMRPGIIPPTAARTPAPVTSESGA